MPVERDERPWGSYEVLLDAPDHKVKQISVKPGTRLSYQVLGSYFGEDDIVRLDDDFGRS